MLSRRGFVGGVMGMAAMGRLLRAADGGDKPNIVFILADDLGWGDVACYNPQGKVPTPNMDRLAGEGVKCVDAHSGSAVCTPTRYGILTGRYCWRTRLKRGVLEGFGQPLVEPDRLNVASMLRGQGYATACIGKWHLGMEWAGKPDAKKEDDIDFSKPVRGGPVDVGFDYFFGIAASLDMPPYAFIEGDRLTAQPTAWMEKQGAVRAGPRDPAFRFEDVLPGLAEKASAWIDQRGKDGRPFFLYFSLNSPHTPVAPAAFMKGRSQAGDYGDFVWGTDWAVGQVMEALKRNGLAKNTLVIVTSDNGSTNRPMTEYGHLPNGPWRGRKSTIWEGGHRVPFIARWPARIPAGSVCDQTICLGDLMATAAAMVGANLPDNCAEDSFNILPALLGDRQWKRPGLVVHHSIDGMFSIRDGKWKYIAGRGSGGWEGKGDANDPEGQLYDMSADPAEKSNLYSSEPAVVERLKQTLERYQNSGRSRA